MVLRQAEEKIAGVRIDVLDAAPLSAMEGEILPVPDIRAKLDLGARPDRLPLLWHGVILARTLYSTMPRTIAGANAIRTCISSSRQRAPSWLNQVRHGSRPLK